MILYVYMFLYVSKENFLYSILVIFDQIHYQKWAKKKALEKNRYSLACVQAWRLNDSLKKVKPTVGLILTADI